MTLTNQMSINFGNFKELYFIQVSSGSSAGALIWDTLTQTNNQQNQVKFWSAIALLAIVFKAKSESVLG